MSTQCGVSLPVLFHVVRDGLGQVRSGDGDGGSGQSLIDCVQSALSRSCSWEKLGSNYSISRNQ